MSCADWAGAAALCGIVVLLVGIIGGHLFAGESPDGETVAHATERVSRSLLDGDSLDIRVVQGELTKLRRGEFAGIVEANWDRFSVCPVCRHFDGDPSLVGSRHWREARTGGHGRECVYRDAIQSLDRRLSVLSIRSGGRASE